MAIECDSVLTGIVSALALAYLAFQLRNRRWSAVVAFAVIGALTCCGSRLNVVPCSNVCVCLLMAIIGSNVVALPTAVSNHTSTETFANHEDGDHSDKDGSETVVKKSDGEGEDSDHDSDHDGDHDEDSHTKDKTHGGHNKHRKKAQHSKKDNRRKKDASTDEPDSDNDSDDHVDSFSTFMETYRSLSPDQVESMTTDTKDLISTQKALMETVQNLAPVISQGKEMMDTFKDYFGPNGTSDMLKAFNTSTKKSV